MSSDNSSRQTPDWHTRSLPQLLEALSSDPARGLTRQEAQRRREELGPNRLAESRRRSLAAMFLGQFADFMIQVLLAAALISGVIGDPQDAVAILVIVLINAVIGSVQEYRADRALAALQAMSPLAARVVRDGEHLSLHAVDLVPGDLVLLEAGDVVPADLRLIEAVELQANESSLTGESQVADKAATQLADADLPLGGRVNMMFKSSLVTHGRARGVVVATGMATEVGRIAELLRTQETVKTPLQQRLSRFGRYLALAVIAICAVVFLSGLLQGQPVLLMFLTAVSLAVAAIPEALPAVVTVSLALGARSLSRQNALVRNLPAVETLGSVTYICTDKTGTLTLNRMTAGAYLVQGERFDRPPSTEASPWRELLQAMALSNDVTERDGEPAGDPTEVALYVAAREAGIQKQVLEERLHRSAELAFDSERKRMATLHEKAGGVIAFVKGAPEAVLSLCKDQLDVAGTAGIDLEALTAQSARLAEKGYRVLALAQRSLPAMPVDLRPGAIEQGLTLLGLVGLIDPPRPEVPDALADCRAAGIIPVMITGDHPGTARAIGLRLGILEEGGEVMTGRGLARLSDDDFDRCVKSIRVYARVSPEQKTRIVEALQRKGEFVAMTGDGVNDAPALKRAGIGVAMGRKGTDVAREAADMVLLDDNFATIVQAVRAGRRIFDNIRKFIRYTMTSNSGEIWTLFLAPFLGLPVPLLPIHILWINLVTDGLPGLALTAEPAEPGLMKRPPRSPQESIFAHGMWQHMVWVGLFIGGLSIAAQAWAWSRGEAYWQTVVFTVLTFSQLFHALAVRAEHASLWRIGLLSNLPILGAILLTVALQLLVVYLPALNGIFHTQPLPVPVLLGCFAVSALVLVAVEVEKWLVRRGVIYKPQPEVRLDSKKR
ncbi:MAG: cation-translocating P-type ATPase [Thiocapsa sp.]|nr:cation-translocating P-type ATPase [Thiocapsa sp.]MCG6984609.1 cation-translocating P-type ATPase [Thiocapsa sp.]